MRWRVFRAANEPFCRSAHRDSCAESPSRLNRRGGPVYMQALTAAIAAMRLTQGEPARNQRRAWRPASCGRRRQSDHQRDGRQGAPRAPRIPVSLRHHGFKTGNGPEYLPGVDRRIAAAPSQASRRRRSRPSRACGALRRAADALAPTARRSQAYASASLARRAPCARFARALPGRTRLA